MRSAILAAAFVAVASTYDLYRQCDGRWGNEFLGTGNNVTIC